jgi:predicted Zn-dependent protease
MSDAVLPLPLLLAGSVDDSFRAALIDLERGDLASAQSNLEAASKAAPRDGRVWVSLSQTYWRLHKNAEAEAAAGKATAFGPEDPAVLQGLAIYYSETDQTLKAAQAQAKYARARSIIWACCTRRWGSRTIRSRRSGTASR